MEIKLSKFNSKKKRKDRGLTPEQTRLVEAMEALNKALTNDKRAKRKAKQPKAWFDGGE